MTDSKKVLLGMSGGVDSSVAAILLREKGYEIIGVTFFFADLKEQNSRNEKEAKYLADKLRFEHHTVNLTGRFKEVVLEPFMRAYFSGETPFPCAVCNPELKFKQLEQLADEHSCDFIATGHYVNVIREGNSFFVTQGIDNEKDQSFFLWGLRQNILEKVLFPLGGLYKKQVKEIARQNNFHDLSGKKESYGICFYEGSDYREYLLKDGMEAKTGFIKDTSGNIVGEHKGIINYTIGQRRGLGIESNKPFFVTDILPGSNEIVVGDYHLLYRNKIRIRNYYFTDLTAVFEARELIVRIRYRLQETPCSIDFINEQEAEITLHKPVAMVAKGQTAVLYSGNQVLGGGFIVSST